MEDWWIGIIGGVIMVLILTMMVRNEQDNSATTEIVTEPTHTYCIDAYCVVNRNFHD